MADVSSDVDAKVKKSLEGTPFEASTLTQLSGGSVNYTYKATLAKALDDGTKQVFVKHAEPYMKVRPDTALSLERGVSFFSLYPFNYKQRGIVRSIPSR